MSLTWHQALLSPVLPALKSSAIAQMGTVVFRRNFLVAVGGSSVDRRKFSNDSVLRT